MRIPPEIDATPAPTGAVVEDAKRALHTAMPLVVQTLYSVCDGCSTPDGVVLYSAEAIAERNSTWEVAVYAPRFVAVGDDSGGRVLLVAATGDALWVDSGSMDPKLGVPLGRDFVGWIEAGLPLSDLDEEPPQFADVYLEKVPEGGLCGLLAVKRELGFEANPGEMKQMLGEVPVRILRRVPYGKALVRCRRVNAVNDCVGLREVDDPARRLRDPLDAPTPRPLDP